MMMIGNGDYDNDKKLLLTNVSFQRRLNFCSRCYLLTYLHQPCTSDAALHDDDDGDDGEDDDEHVDDHNYGKIDKLGFIPRRTF